MLDMSDYEVWIENPITKRLFELIIVDKSEADKLILESRDFEVNGLLKSIYYKGISDTYSGLLKLDPEVLIGENSYGSESAEIKGRRR